MSRRYAAVSATPKPKVVERRIRFYRAHAGMPSNTALTAFDPEQVLKHMASLNGSNAHRWMGSDGTTYGCWVDRTAFPQRMRFGIFRSTALPHVERSGVLQPLAEREIVEVVHVVFFGNGILGSDFNFYGPRVPRLANYLPAVASTVCPPLWFEALISHSAIQQLARLKRVRLLRLKIRASYAERIKQADLDLGFAFVAARNASQADEVEIVFRPATHSRNWIASSLLEPIRQLAGWRDMDSGVLRFDVRGLNGDTDRIETIDVLSDLLMTKKKIMLHHGQTGSLDPESAYRAIEESYEELRGQLETARGVSE